MKNKIMVIIMEFLNRIRIATELSETKNILIDLKKLKLNKHVSDTSYKYNTLHLLTFIEQC